MRVVKECELRLNVVVPDPPPSLVHYVCTRALDVRGILPWYRPRDFYRKHVLYHSSLKRFSLFFPATPALYV